MSNLSQPDHMTMNNGMLSPQSLQIRLDTSTIITQIENFLNGVGVVNIFDKTTKKYIPEEKNYGKTFANDEGIRNIMFMISSIFNRAIVQGNILDFNMHRILVAEIYEDITDIIFLNLKKWKIPEEKLDMIITTIMHMIELFLTRTIADGERGTLYGAPAYKSEAPVQDTKTSGGIFRFGGNQS